MSKKASILMLQIIFMGAFLMAWSIIAILLSIYFGIIGLGLSAIILFSFGYIMIKVFFNYFIDTIEEEIKEW